MKERKWMVNLKKRWKKEEEESEITFSTKLSTQSIVGLEFLEQVWR